MVWESLIDRTLTSFDAGTPRVKVRKYLEEAEVDFALGTKCYVKDWSYMHKSGSISIPLPNDFVEVVGQVEYDTAILDHRRDFKVSSRFKKNNQLKTGTPQSYYVRGDKMFIYPVSGTGLVTFSYAAMPTHLDPLLADPGYVWLRFKDLTYEQFYSGDSIEGLTSGATAEVVDVVNVYQDHGYLVLKDWDQTSFQDSEQIYKACEEEGMWGNIYASWEDLLDDWASLGLGGVANARGIEYDYSDPGVSPVIPDVYHADLIHYARSALYADQADDQRSLQSKAIYETNKQEAGIQLPMKGYSGPNQIIDTMFR